MMKFKFFLLGGLLLTPRFVLAQQTEGPNATVTMSSQPVAGSALPITPIILTPVPNKAFDVGEKLVFTIKYQFISAGTAYMEVNEGAVINGSRTYNFLSRAESNSVIDKIFKVRDVNSSTVDRESLNSVAFHQNLREGNFHVIRNTTIDYAKRNFVFEKIYEDATRHHEGTIEEPLHDILSSFFYARTLDLKPGNEYFIRVFSDRNVYSLKIVVHPKVQKIKVPAGRFECLRLDPFVQGDGIFKAKDGKMSLWVTNDEKKMPVLIRSRVFIGSFDAELTSYQLPKPQ